MGCVHLAVGAGGGDTRGDGTSRGGVFATGRGGGLATSCVVKVVSAVLMLFSEMFCLSISSWRWCCRHPKASAMPWGVSRGNNIWRAEFPEDWV